MTVGERDPAAAVWQFGERLQDEMTSRGWSARRLAEQAKISAATVGNMLRGYLKERPTEPWRPTEPNVRAIALALGHPPDEWLRMAGYHVPEAPSMADAAVVERVAARLPYLQTLELQAVEVLVNAALRGRDDVPPAPPTPIEAPAGRSHAEITRPGPRTHEEVGRPSAGRAVEERSRRRTAGDDDPERQDQLANEG